MAQQLTDIKTDAFDVLGYNSNDPLLDDTTMTRLVNQALRQLSTEYDWPWLYTEGTITLAAGTSDYSIASNTTRWSRTKWMAIEEHDLRYLSTRQMQQIIGDTAQTGQPYAYAIEGHDNFRFGPIPDQAYTVTHAYYQSEAALSSGTDTPALPDAYDGMLVMYVAKKMAMRKGAFDDLRVVENEIRMWDKRARDNVRTASAFPRIKNRKDWSPRV